MASMRATAGEPRLDCPTTCVAVPRRRWPGFQSSQPLGSADSRPSAFRSRRTVLGPPTWLANAQTEEVREPEPRPAVELPILRNNASGPKLLPLRCTVPGSRIRDRRTGTAQNGYLGQKREQSADQRGTIQKPHLKLVTKRSAGLQVRCATPL